MTADKKESKFVSVVVYLHNSGRNIESFFDKVLEMFQENFEKYEIICVNDASTDQSVKEIKKIAKEYPDVIINVVNMSYYQGQEFSMNAGVQIRRLEKVRHYFIKFLINFLTINTKFILSHSEFYLEELSIEFNRSILRSLIEKQYMQIVD